MIRHNLRTVVSFETVRTLTKKKFWISTLIVPVVGAIIIALVVLSNSVNRPGFGAASMRGAALG